MNSITGFLFRLLTTIRFHSILFCFAFSSISHQSPHFFFILRFPPFCAQSAPRLECHKHSLSRGLQPGPVGGSAISESIRDGERVSKLARLKASTSQSEHVRSRAVAVNHLYLWLWSWLVVVAHFFKGTVASPEPVWSVHTCDVGH